MTFVRLLLAATLSLATIHASAREPVPIVNHENVPVAAAGAKQLSAAQVKQAIVRATPPRPWEFTETGPGKLLATLQVRGKHTVSADIAYSADQYSIVYRDSANMKYGSAPDGRPVIHPFYNTWIGELREAIRISLSKT